MRLLSLAAVALAGLTGGSLANDTMATLGTGGLVFVQTEDVKLLSEDLYVSPDEVRVSYEFRNDSGKDTRTLVAFPMPDITGSPDFMTAVPTQDSENLFGFSTLFNGEPVDVELHQYAFTNNIEYTDYLKELGLPLAPQAPETIEAVEALTDVQKEELFHLGLAIPLEFDSGNGEEKHYYPSWTLKSTYSWWAEFPAGEVVTVEHSYKPSVGGTVAVTFLTEPSEGYDPASDYLKKYCTDQQLISTLKKSLPSPEEMYSAPYTESWISYIWSTGANWGGPIGKFHLTIDKGRPENLVSFCWDGEVKKTSPTTFEMEATDFWPPWNRELEILILNRNDPVPDNVG